MPRRPLAAAFAVALSLLPMACGRTEPYRYRWSEDASSSDAAVDAGLVCVDGVLNLERAVPSVMLVLDRSTSMRKSFGTSGTRWEGVVSALAVALPPVDQSMELGELIFPSTDSSSESCDVSLATDAVLPALGNAQALLDRMEATSPGGHTPTAQAVLLAGKVLLAIHVASTARALVLATDGAPDCNTGLDPATCTCASGNGHCSDAVECLDDVQTIDTIGSLEAAGVPTYVIGIQESSSEFIEVLNEMAVAGGRPYDGAQSYYAVTSESEMEQAFITIRDQVGSCTWLSSSVPDDDGSIEVSLDGVVVPYDPDQEAGWAWSDRVNGELTLYGEACDRAATSAAPVVSATVLCERPDAGSASADAGPGATDAGD